MHRFVRPLLAVPIALASVASVCEDDPPLTGTYHLRISESLDSCDDERNGYPLEVTISRNDSGFTIQIDGGGTLTGDFDEDGVLVASGTIADLGGGRTTLMQIGIVIRQGQVTDGTGRITFNGTFPGEPGQCIQELFILGDRIGGDLVPVLGLSARR